MSEVNRVRGFTMIELVTILVIVAIMAYVTLPKLGQLNTYSLTDTSNELLEAIRFVQESSMVQVDNQYQIVIGGGDKFRVRQYNLNTSTLSDMPSPVSNTTPFTPQAADWTGVSVGSLTLSFDNRGYPCASAAPCSTPMTSSQSLTISSSGDSKSITIEAITGYAYAN